VEFAPQVAGALTGALSISDSDGSSPQLVTMTGTGVGASLSPTTLAFGTEPLGTTSASKTVTLSNALATTLTITSATITGTNAGDFAIAATSTCTGTLAASSSCKYNITFKPSIEGAESAALTVVDSLGTQTATLSGTGTIAKLSATSVNFGNVTEGTTGTKTVTLTNVSASATLTITSFTMTGTDPADFGSTSGNPPCSGSLAPLGTCTITLTFTPPTTGALKATYNLNDNGGGSPQTIALSGTGVAAAVTKQ
jgi:hypothetical protein